MLFQRPLVMPMVNMMKKLYRPVFSTTTPCSARNLVTMLAGMPVLANLPFRSRPGVTMVDLIGSSMLKPVGHLAEAVPVDAGLGVLATRP